MRRLAFAAAAAATLLAVPQAARAQVGIGVAGGPVFPVGDMADGFGRGFHAGVVLDLALPLFPVGVRGEAMYQRLPAEGAAEDYDHLSVGVNGRLTLLPLPLVSGYVTAGAGLFRSDFPGSDPAPADGSSTDVGLNGGVGARINALFVRGFVEVRYQRVISDPARSFVPITVGIVF